MQPDADTTPADAATAWARHGEARLKSLAGWHRLAAAFMLGATSILAMAPFFLWPVLLLTLPALLWLVDAADEPRPDERRWPHLDKRRLRDAGLVGWSFAWGYHVAGLYWLREAFLVTGGALGMLWPLGVVALPAFLALYTGLAAAAAVALAPAGPRRVVALALTLAVSEWARGTLLTGFPWNVYGLALTGQPALMQSVSLVGIWGMTMITVLVLTIPMVVLAGPPGRLPKGWPRPLVAGLLLTVPLALMAVFGTLRLRTPLASPVDGVKVRLVQPSIPQHEKWRPENQPAFLRQQLALSLQAPDGTRDDLAGISHVIWPEAALPFLPLQRPEVLQAIADALPDRVHLVAGIIRAERGPRSGAATGSAGEFRVYNSLAVFDGEGGLVGVYDKTHLVPFGEYLPFQDVLEWIGLSALTRQRGGFAIGPTPRPFLELPGMPGAAPLICYEGAFPGIGKASAGRPAVMINTTNDGWFGDTTGPRQHAHQARLRAVEEGVPLLRVANNGITAAYDAYGRELGRLGMNEIGVIDTVVPARIEPPAYARWGDFPFAIVSIVGLLALLGLRVKHQ